MLLRERYTSRLVSEGHEVVWSSTFDDARKRYRFRTETCVDVANHYRVWLLHPGIKYSGHVSIARIINHYLVADRFYDFAHREPAPVVILCSLPTLGLSYVATTHGHANRVSVFIHARDMWPDIFLKPAPMLVRPIARLALQPFRMMARRACSSAAAIVGMTPHFVEWGLMYAAVNERHSTRTSRSPTRNRNSPKPPCLTQSGGGPPWA